MLKMSKRDRQGGGKMFPNVLLGVLAAVLVVTGIVSRVKK